MFDLIVVDGVSIVVPICIELEGGMLIVLVATKAVVTTEALVTAEAVGLTVEDGVIHVELEGAMLVALVVVRGAVVAVAVRVCVCVTCNRCLKKRY